jgi:hypothetical protein
VACIDDPHRFKNGRQVAAYFGLVPRQFQSGETDRNGRITKRGNPLARTILTECAWASLRYNPWAKAVYDRIYGKQKTRKKKAAIALARKIAVLAWAMLRDEKDWDPSIMIETTKSFGGKLPLDEKDFKEMKPKENSDQRKSRLRKEAREAKIATLSDIVKTSNKSTSPSKASKAKGTPTTKRKPSRSSSKPITQTASKRTSQSSASPKRKPTTQPRRARKLVSRSDA